MFVYKYNLNLFKECRDTFVGSKIEPGELVVYAGPCLRGESNYGIIIAIYNELVVVLWAD